jgi:hypothetical protein
MPASTHASTRNLPNRAWLQIGDNPATAKLRPLAGRIWLTPRPRWIGLRTNCVEKSQHANQCLWLRFGFPEVLAESADKRRDPAGVKAGQIPPPAFAGCGAHANQLRAEPTRESLKKDWILDSRQCLTRVDQQAAAALGCAASKVWFDRRDYRDGRRWRRG